MFKERVKEAFWGIILPSLKTLKAFLTSSEFRELIHDQVKRRSTIKLCVSKASSCYRQLTGYGVAKSISLLEVEQTVFFSSDQQELLANLRKCSFGHDEQYVLLLYMAIINTYAPTRPVWMIDGQKFYGLPGK